MSAHRRHRRRLLRRVGRRLMLVAIVAVGVRLGAALVGTVAVSAVTAASVTIGAVVWWARVVEPWLFAPRMPVPPAPRPVRLDDDRHLAFAQTLAAVAVRYLADREAERRPQPPAPPAASTRWAHPGALASPQPGPATTEPAPRPTGTPVATVADPVLWAHAERIARDRARRANQRGSCANDTDPAQPRDCPPKPAELADHDGAAPIAWVDWWAIPAFADRVEHTSCSTSEARILRLAAELAGVDTATPLAELTSSLNDTNSRLVLDAIAHVLTRGYRR